MEQTLSKKEVITLIREFKPIREFNIDTPLNHREAIYLTELIIEEMEKVYAIFDDVIAKCEADKPAEIASRQKHGIAVDGFSVDGFFPVGELSVTTAKSSGGKSRFNENNCEYKGNHMNKQEAVQEIARLTKVIDSTLLELTSICDEHDINLSIYLSI